MTPILFASAIHVVFRILMSVTAVFLMLIVLVQRGRGGGLAGAFGGAGGQSAFGTKAGDLFTRITIGAAVFWILLCLVALKVLGTTDSLFGEDVPATATEGLVAPEGSGGADATGTDEAAPATDGLGAGTEESTGSGEPAGEGGAAGAEAGEGSSEPASSGTAPAGEDSKKD